MKRSKPYKRKESKALLINKVIDSFDFEPINMSEIIHRLRKIAIC